MEKFISGILRIKRILDNNTSEELAKFDAPIIDWANKHEIAVSFGWNSNLELLAEYQVGGYTSAYCLGFAKEFRFLVEKHFNCETEIMFESVINEKQ